MDSTFWTTLTKIQGHYNIMMSDSMLVSLPGPSLEDTLVQACFSSCGYLDLEGSQKDDNMNEGCSMGDAAVASLTPINVLDMKKGIKMSDNIKQHDFEEEIKEPCPKTPPCTTPEDEGSMQ